MILFPQQLWDSGILSLTEETTPHGRWYTLPNGNRYASVTTMLSATAPQDKLEGLRQWRERVGDAEALAITARAAGEGTRMHSVLEEIITNRWTPFQHSQLIPNIKSLLNQMVPILEQHITAIHASELPLFSDQLGIAGRTDCLCTWDGRYTILDFKRSNKPKTESMIEDYFLQTTCYALMAEERFGIEIPMITVLIGVSTGEGPQMWHFPKTKYLLPLHERLERFHALSFGHDRA